MHGRHRVKPYILYWIFVRSVKSCFVQQTQRINLVVLRVVRFFLLV
jgi:hypothetical protein